MEITRRSSFATIVAVFSGMAGCTGDPNEGTDDPKATETRDKTDTARSRRAENPNQERNQKDELSKRKAAKRLDCARSTVSRALERSELYGL